MRFGQVHRFFREVTDGDIMVHESCRHVHITILLEKLWSCDGVWILLDCKKGDELIKGMIYQ
jgi:hypothetical protein